MVFPGLDWEERSSESQSIDSSKMREALEFLRSRSREDGIREVVVVRNGYLVWKGDNIDNRHTVHSCTKSFTSAVLGLMVQEGMCTLETPAWRHEPLLAEWYRGVTLRHLANFTSGYDAVGFMPQHAHGYGGTGDWGPDPYDVAPPLFAPGASYCYHDEAMRMFARVLTRILGRTMLDFLRSRVADAIGMGLDWGTLGEIGGLHINDGASHISISARDMARWGHLFLNQGNWNGRQLMDAEWVRQSTSCQVPVSIGVLLDDSRRIDGRGIYGYHWWVNGSHADGTRHLPGVPLGTFYRTGFAHNIVVVVPEWKIVIVRLGADGDPPDRLGTWREFLRRMGEAVQDA